MDKRRQGDTLVPCQHLGGRRQQVSTQPGLEEKISPNDWSYHLKLRDKQKPRKSPGKDRPFPSISRGGQQWPTPWCHSFQNLEAKKKKTLCWVSHLVCGILLQKPWQNNDTAGWNLSMGGTMQHSCAWIPKVQGRYRGHWKPSATKVKVGRST